MIHVVVMKRLIGLPLLMHIELLWRSRSQSFKNRGVGVLKIEKSESKFLKIEESESEGILGWVGVGKKYPNSDSDFNLKP
jgi:hypothetical protein